MAGHHILEWAVPLITAFFLLVLATKGEAPTTVMMAMAGEKAAVAGVMAPDELLMHPLVTVGLILAASRRWRLSCRQSSAVLQSQQAAGRYPGRLESGCN